MIEETSKEFELIKKIMKKAQDRQKSYADLKEGNWNFTRENQYS